MTPSQASTSSLTNSWVDTYDRLIYSGERLLPSTEGSTATASVAVAEESCVLGVVPSELDEAARAVEEIWRERTKPSKECKLVHLDTMENAKSFLSVLSNHTSNSPEVSAYPDGEIEFSWESSRGKLLVLVDETSIYYFFKTRTGRRRKGSEIWNFVIPMEILEALSSIYATA